MSENRNNAGMVAASFFGGMLIGAGIALLYAPLSGRETREEIGELVGKVRKKTGEYVAEKAEDLKDVAGKMAAKE